MFVRRQGMWYIVHHHATLIKPANAEKQGQQQPSSQLMQQLQSLAGRHVGLDTVEHRPIDLMRRENTFGAAAMTHLALLSAMAGLNGAKIINLGGLKGAQGGAGSGMGLDDLAAQLGALERQLGEPRKPRVKVLKDGKYQVRVVPVCIV